MARIDCDVPIVGAGPAGLTAATYLSRFHLRTVIAHDDDSRAALIPLSRNHAGFPESIAGVDLLRRMAEQATRYGTTIVGDRIERIERDAAEFVACGERTYRAKAVLLATGVINHRPAIDDALHAEALAAGALRYCPICDGFEVTDRRVGVIGTGERGMTEALFLRSYTADLTLVAPDGPHSLTAPQHRDLVEAGVIMIDGPARDFRLVEGGIELSSAAGVMSFASIYPALGSTNRSELAIALGARTESTGSIVVDAHQRTSVTGLYAAGDVVLGLDQISHAMGEGGVAATTIRNDLAAVRPLYR